VRVRLLTLSEIRLRINRVFARFVVAGLIGAVLPMSVSGQADVQSVDLSVGRSLPITEAVAITRASIVNPEIADLVVIGTREVVINAKAPGETDAILWLADGRRRHLRVSVRSAPDRMQIAIYIKMAEVRRDVLRQFGVSALYSDRGVRVGTGQFRTDKVFDQGGNVLLGPDVGFVTVLTDLGTKNLLALIELEETQGRARTLAEPNLMAGNREEATFLAGGELPIPVLQGGDLVGQRVTIMYKEFGVRLQFMGEIISDSLIKLTVRPEVSSLDFGNGITISGFRIPAFRTRRVETTVDVRRDQAMIISGLFNTERERVRTGVPFLQDIPILGNLFSSTRWQSSDSELLVVVRPVLVDPYSPRVQDVLRLKPDTTLPARPAIEPRLQDPNLPHGGPIPPWQH
jgi:pilus assembly protein CpaC